MQTKERVVPPRPPFWLRLTIVSGNLLQLSGIVAGVLLLYLTAHMEGSAVLRIVLMLLGWLAIYICTHASAHWLVGRLVGIRFKGYGIRGSDHPYDYPPIPGLRRAMTYFPTFTSMTQKESMQAASPLAKAMMFAAGETSTTICSILVAWYAYTQGVPGGRFFLIAMVVYSVIVTVVTALTPRGDYAKALNALHARAVVSDT